MCSCFAATGILCDEPLRGVRFNIRDAKLHQDPAHRGGGAIMPMTRRVMCAAQLASKPVLLEPVFAVEVGCVQVVYSIFGCFTKYFFLHIFVFPTRCATRINI